MRGQLPGRPLATPGPEDHHGIDLGAELDTFRASRSALFARAARGPAIVVAGLVLLVLQGVRLESSALATQLRWEWLVFGAASVASGIHGLRSFVAMVLLRLTVHERGFVLRSAEGRRVVRWEAVQEIRLTQRRWGAVALRMRLIHGEQIDIAEDLGELDAAETRLRSLAGQKFCD